MRALLAVLLVLGLAFGLAACGDSSGGGEPAGDTAGSQVDGDDAEDGEDEEGDDAAEAGDAEDGLTVYTSTCLACHGPGGVGVTGLGKPLVDNAFVQGLTDAEVMDFIKKGRDPSDPLNTTGVAMPPKGGNPALDDEDIADVIAYVRTLQP